MLTPPSSFISCVYACVWVSVPQRMCRGSEENSQESVLCFHHVGDPGTKLRASGAVTMAFTPRSHPIGPMFHFAYYFPFNHRDSLKLIHVLLGGGRTRSVCLGAETGCPKSRLYMLRSSADMTKCILGTAGGEQLRLRGHRV